ncbi:MAG: hypothetical protein ATN36_06655 [Epulopiscium sp. Nele67-Bin005]|nr:MAG: hypothetical protein ATN36_06655 [Epulopiscium sp. Nele67-Bin005]
MKIYIDAGHRNNQNDFGAVGNGYKESALALTVSDELKTKLENLGITCYMSRNSEAEYLSLQERTNKANSLGVDLYLCVHINAATATTANGFECLYKHNATLSNLICDNVCNSTGQRNRGAKQRTDLHVLNSSKMEAVLLEMCFISNVDDLQYVLDDALRNKATDAVVNAIVTHFKYEVAPTSNNIIPINKEETRTQIVAKTTSTIAKMKTWAKTKGATQTFIDNADTYFVVCNVLGINATIAYAQYGYESGFGKHTGVVDESFCNPCGLKTNIGGDCKDPNAHQRFLNWKEGIMAHVDHIALYAGLPNYPKETTFDPRHFQYLYGLGATIEDLSNSWCPSNPDYANKLLSFVAEIENTLVEDEPNPTIEIALDGIIKKVEAINIGGHNFVKLRDLACDKIKIDYDKIPIVTII